MYFLAFIAIFGFLLIAYELSGKRTVFTAKVLGKQRRILDGEPDLFYIEVWYECPNGPNVYGIFVDSNDFNRLWEGDVVKFTAKKGKLLGWLYNRKLS